MEMPKNLWNTEVRVFHSLIAVSFVMGLISSVCLRPNHPETRPRHETTTTNNWSNRERQSLYKHIQIPYWHLIQGSCYWYVPTTACFHLQEKPHDAPPFRESFFEPLLPAIHILLGRWISISNYYTKKTNNNSDGNTRSDRWRDSFENIQPLFEWKRDWESIERPSPWDLLNSKPFAIQNFCPTVGRLLPDPRLPSLNIPLPWNEPKINRMKQLDSCPFILNFGELHASVEGCFWWMVWFPTLTMVCSGNMQENYLQIGYVTMFRWRKF